MNGTATSRPRDLDEVAARLARLPAERQVEFLRRLVECGIPLARLPVVPLGRDDRPPLSFAQSRLWFLWQLDPASPAYNLHLSYRLCGVLDRDALAGALSDLVARHEALRTTFAEEGGEPFQRIAGPAPVDLGVRDLSSVPVAQREAAAQQAIEAEANAPFDLREGPLLRAGLLRLAASEHLLLLTVHHIVADGWSLQLAIAELLALYRARLKAERPTLAPLPLHYADFALWQRRLAEAGETDRQLAWWTKKLAGDAPVLELPLDFPRPAVRHGQGASLACHLDATLTAALERQAAAHGASLFMLLLAAFKALLFRYSGQADIRIGVPVANRNRIETEGLIGLFVNTLVLRGAVAGPMRFDELLASARATTLEAQDHQDLPFERLVEALQPGRSLSSTPLFQVVHNHLDDRADEGPDLPGLAVTEVERGERATGFDLALDTAETRSGRLYLALTYATDLFAEATVARLRDHFLAILHQVAAAPRTRIADLRLLAPAEAAQLDAWNAGAADWPVLPDLSEAIAAQAALRSDEPALLCGDAELSHGELHLRANRLAHRLRRLGVGPDTLVGVALERSIDLVVCLLAVLRAGGAYVPLDPDYPPERLRLMTADSGLALLLTHGGLRHRLPSAEGTLTLEVDQLDLSGEACSVPGVEAHPGNLAYLVYTSGSTGRPKGVAVARGPLAMHCQAIGARYGMSPRDRELIFMSFSFDGAHERWLTALSHGGSVVVRGPELWTPEQTFEALHRYGVTVTALPPAYLAQLAEVAAERGNPPPVRVYCFAGDAVPQASYELVRRTLAPELIVNGYGPTETVVTPLLWQADRAASCDAAYAPIGDRVGARSAWVLDGDLNPVPVGVTGELHLGGLGLARGYHGRPGLTAERFVPDPFGADGGRLYRTGDRVRQRADGLVDYLGRVDHQVKIRGFRVEPGEIEACLATHQEVREALVVVRDTPFGRQLVGYVAADRSELADELRAHLKGRVPDYMVPAQIVVLDRLPVNANGKLDRDALPEPQWRSRDAVAPRSAMERRLAAIWREVLGVPHVGVGDDFFALGGHSLLALRVVARLQAELDLPIEVRSLFEAPTLEEFALAVERTQPAATRPPPLIRRPASADRLPSFAQQRLWFLWRLDPDSAAYNIPLALRLRGGLEPARLERALGTVVERHETLRTVFVEADGHLRQRIQATWPSVLELVEIADVEQARWLAAAEAARPFDLASGPLLRARLLRLAPDDHVLLLTLHHIAADAWSMRLLVDETLAVYQGAALPALPVQFADYAEWQRDWLAAGEEQRQLAFWSAQLGDAGIVIDLPTDRPRPAEQSHRGAQHGIVLPAALARRLAGLALERHATPHMVLLAGFFGLLQHWTGQSDLRIGVPVANRGRPEIEPLIGFFVNTQVVRAQVDGRQGFAALLDQVRAASLAAQSHQDLPFERLVEALHPERSLAHNPLFQVMFSHEPLDRALPRPAGLTVEELSLPAVATQFDLSLTTDERDDGSIGCTFTYATDLFEAASIAHLGTQLLRLLTAAVAAPETPLERLPLLDAAERERLVRIGTGRALDPGAARCLHELFEAQARLRPDAIAVSLGETTLTYGELNARANRLAHRLRRLGVGPDWLVGLAVERSLEMVLGILGILKAGGAYLPLDPAAPRERIAYMLRDSRVTLLLTQQRLLGALPEDEVRRWCLDRDWSEVADHPADDPRIALTPDQLAYCIYTSGSTGTPKGALLTHRNVERLLRTTQADFAFAAEDVWTLFHSFAFDFSVWEIFGALCHGGRLVVVPHEVTRSPEDFHTLLLRERVTVLNQTPSAFQQLARVALERGDDLPLRCVVFGGEALEIRSLRPWFDRFGDEAPVLVNMYGITETTVHVSYRPLRRADAEAGGSPIGGALGDLSWHVLDGNLEPAPMGMPGEIHVAGAGLARGYHGRPALTAERFVPSAFGAPGERLYRTGDLARRLVDGSLDYRGRADQQVKIRGFRIEPGEIEARLREHPDVEEAVVVARDGPLGKRLVGYVVATAAGGLAERLKAHLRTHLPEHMVPSALVALERLPLTVNGKLDRAALPEPEIEAAGFVAPAGEIETRLAAIWCEVLELPRVGASDNFFDLGGDSIVSIQVVSRARAAGLALSPRHLFQHQTVRELAQAASLPAPAAPAAPDPRPDLADAACRLGVPVTALADAYLLSPMQQGMLFHTVDGSDGASDLYINQMTVDAIGLDPRRFVAAWQAVVDRHTVLRTGFLWEGMAEPIQFVRHAAALPVRELDWRDLALAPETLNELAAEEKARGFQLSAPPLMRLVLVRLAQDRWRLVWTYHHALIDGWSTSHLVGEVLRVYRGAPLEPSAPYRDYIDWLRRQDADATERFWRGRLAALEEPTSLAGAIPANPRGQGHEAVYTKWGRERTRALAEFARRERITLNTLVQGAWLLLLQRCTGQATVCFGATVAGRPASLPGAETMLGLFINTLPVIQAPPAAETVGRWLRALQAENLAMREHEHAPLADLQRWAGLAGRALFDSIIVFENHPIDRTLRDWEDERLRFEGGSDAGVTNFPMDLMVTSDGDGLEIEYMFRRDSFERPGVERLRGHLEWLLAQLAQDAERRLGEIGLADAGELGWLVGLNAPVADAMPHLPVHRLIAQCATERPDAMALVGEDAALTFGELEARANGLAWRLAEQGVGPESVVGVAMRRSPALLVAFLAVLKAGGAYVPIDADYPRDRVAYMIGDAGLALLLTDAATRRHLPLPEGLPVLEVDPADGGAAEPPRRDLHPASLAYLIYTSGSTGRPKAVAVSHGPLAMHVRAIGTRYGMGPRDRELIFMSLSFDGAHERWLTALAHGGGVVLRGDAPWSAEETLEALRRHGVTVAAFPPAFLQQLAEQAQQEGEPPPLRVLCFGGDAVPEAGLELVRRTLRPERIVNGYGPTETVITPLLWDAGATCGAAYAPIGDRVGDRSAWALDGALNPLPAGIAGELHLGGEGIARGYHARPGITAERFVPDPFGTHGGRLYRTGDLVRQRPDGVIDFLGRTDQQVKIRGFRIELGEIEARLRAHPAVRDAAVVLREDPAGKRLVGYVAGEAEDLAGQLLDRLRGELPEHMLPAAIVVLPQLPVNANGKLDRTALPAPKWQRQDAEPPRTAAERALAEIWREVLGVETVGVTDSFFALGGDSILALKMVARVRGRPELGLELRLRDLMQKPTIAELCGGRPPAAVAEPDPLLALNRAPADRRPLFCLHAAFGTVLDYEPLARRLDGIVPVYGVQNRMLVDPAWRDRSLTTLAADQARHIRARQPAGPYRLLGWSLGGTLAVAVAQMLESQGQEVELCGLVDAYVPGEAATAEDGLDGSPELAPLLAVATHLRALAAAAPPLPPIKVRPVSWWVIGREESQRLLAEQVGRLGPHHVLATTHREILRDLNLLGDLAVLLTPAFEIA